MSATASWGYVVEPPDDGWIWLPEPDEDVAGWAQAVCADLYVTGKDELVLAERLRGFAVAYRQRGGDLGAVWVPDPAYGVLASLVADRYQADRTLDQLAAERSAQPDPGLAAPQVSRVELPAGPAVRVRQVERGGATSAGDELVESVTHLVAPDGVQDAEGVPVLVELVTSWTRLQEGDELAALADDVAAGLTITRG